MSIQPEGQAGEEQVDEEMAAADRSNGERLPQDGPEAAQRASGSDLEASSTDPDAPGTYVNDDEASSVAEPNEPA